MVLRCNRCRQCTEMADKAARSHAANPTVQRRDTGSQYVHLAMTRGFLVAVIAYAAPVINQQVTITPTCSATSQANNAASNMAHAKLRMTLTHCKLLACQDSAHHTQQPKQQLKKTQAHARSQQSLTSWLKVWVCSIETGYVVC